MKKYGYIFLFLSVFLSCTDKPIDYKEVDVYPEIFPDYINITVPVNIAPLNFYVPGFKGKGVLSLRGKDTKIDVYGAGKFIIPMREWKKLLHENQGDQIDCMVFLKESAGWKKYKTFQFVVSSDSIDSYLAYRLIEPGYELWHKMGIYQRNLENFRQEIIYENGLTDFNCVNCHSFCMQDPDHMLFHMRETWPGTVIYIDEKIEILNTKTDQTISQLVYPSWHPSGKFIAFSVNQTKQGFHENNENRVEVFDSESDVVVYDVENYELISAPILFSKDAYETFPTFSPDGKMLYFCSADAMPVPEKYDSIQYSLCRVSFDPKTKAFGQQVDTLYNSSRNNRSASFPRVSPDGRYLMFTLSDYGNFSIWHKDADLKLIDLARSEFLTMDNANSEEAESYHSWSSNSRWFTFSSRRVDGLYTRPYFAHTNKEGQVAKPFLLPQKDPEYYHGFMKSYNIPELIKKKVTLNAYRVAELSKNTSPHPVQFRKSR